jgi:hypothetical protein
MTTERQLASRIIELVHELSGLGAPEPDDIAAILGTTFRERTLGNPSELVGESGEPFSEISLALRSAGAGLLTLSPGRGRIEADRFLRRSAFGPETKCLRDLHAPNGGSAHSFFALDNIRLCVETGYTEQTLRRMTLEWRVG